MVVHQCPHCVLDFPNKANLDRHIRSHTHETPFECQFCDYASATAAQVKNHEQRHLTSAFPCPHCVAANFDSEAALNSHRALAHKDWVKDLDRWRGLRLEHTLKKRAERETRDEAAAAASRSSSGDTAASLRSRRVFESSSRHSSGQSRRDQMGPMTSSARRGDGDEVDSSISSPSVIENQPFAFMAQRHYTSDVRAPNTADNVPEISTSASTATATDVPGTPARGGNVCAGCGHYISTGFHDCNFWAHWNASAPGVANTQELPFRPRTLEPHRDRLALPRQTMTWAEATDSTMDIDEVAPVVTPGLARRTGGEYFDCPDCGLVMPRVLAGGHDCDKMRVD